MMKKLSFLSALFALCAGSLFAYVHPAPQNCQNWGVGAEYLYWFPTVDDTYFVIQGTENGNPGGKRINNDFHFHSGFRVEGAYAFDCNRELHVRYARLSTKRNKTITGSALWATVGSPDVVDSFGNFTGEASSSLDLLYQNVDGVFFQQAWQCCPFDLYLFAGIEYAYIRLHSDIDYLSAVNTGNINEKSRTWGVGPEFGIEFYYPLCQFSSCWLPGRLSIAALTSGGLLASKFRQRFFNTLNGLTIRDVTDRHTWRVVPTWNARLGLNYSTCFSCMGASIEVGYEFTSFFRALARLEQPDDVAESLFYTAFDDFSVQGLYVAVDLTF